MNNYQCLYRFKEIKSQEFLEIFELKTGNPNYHILTDLNYVEPIEDTGPIEIPGFEDCTNYHAGMVVAAALNQTNKPIRSFFDDIGLWEWVTYAFYDAFHPTTKIGKDIYRYSPAREGAMRNRWTRHHIRTAVWLYDLFGEDSIFYSCNRLGVSSDPSESGVQTSALVEENVCKLFSMLYYDDENNRRKQGYSSKPRPQDNNLGRPGNMFDLIAFLKQLRTTFVVEAASAQELFDLLPNRFDAWKS